MFLQHSELIHPEYPGVSALSLPHYSSISTSRLLLGVQFICEEVSLDQASLDLPG